METIKFSTVQLKVCELIPAHDNPRTWRENGEAELDDSLQKFDLVEIPVVNFDHTLIAGHRRVERLIAAGRANELIDVRKPNRQLTTEERKEYMLRSNTHQGKWDAEKLAEAFEGFDFEGLEIDEPLIEQEGEVERLAAPQNKILRSYKKTHILISFPPEKITEIMKELDFIASKDFVEYEQGSNG